MIDDKERRKAAQALLEAGDNCKPIRQVSQTWPEMQIEDAYAIQQMWADARVARGARVIGHKIGLTSRAMQQASQITEPDNPVKLLDYNECSADIAGAPTSAGNQGDIVVLLHIDKDALPPAFVEPRHHWVAAITEL